MHKARFPGFIFFAVVGVLLFWAHAVKAQGVLENIKPYITIYDSNETAKLPPLALFSAKFARSPDSVFSGIFNLSSGKEYLSELYPYPVSSVISYQPIRGSNGFFLPALVANGVQPALSYISSVYITDAQLKITDSIKMNYSYQYTYHGDTLSGHLLMDPHDISIVQHNGKRYAFVIGYRNELADESELMHSDSVIMRYSTIHILDVDEHKEVARFEPEKQGFPLEAFYDAQNLTGTIKPYHYSHPHINIIEPHITERGWDIFFSSRDPGIIGKLYWDGRDSLLSLQWLFGSPPLTGVDKFIPSLSSNPITGCHGSSALYRGDTLYIATYNNNARFHWPQKNSSRFQVYMVLRDTTHLIWQSPDIHFISGSRGKALWYGDKLLCVEGREGGIVRGINRDSTKYLFSHNYDRMEIWEPFRNKLITVISVPGDVNYVDWIDSLPTHQAIQMAMRGNNIVLSYPDKTLQYWTIGPVRKTQKELSLPVAYIDSLNRISAWVQTGYSGVWQVDEKEIPNLLPPALKKGMIANLPPPYTWKIFTENNEPVKPEELTGGSYYMFEARLGASAVYRKKHWVEK